MKATTGGRPSCLPAPPRPGYNSTRRASPSEPPRFGIGLAATARPTRAPSGGRCPAAFRSTPARHPPPTGLEQEPGAPLGLVDPNLDQAGGGHVPGVLADVVGLAEARRQRLVVLAQLGQHVLRLDVVRVVVQD